jgi:hypothetical protein
MRALVLVLAAAGCSFPEKVLVDAQGAPFACLGKPLPTTAPDQIKVAGTVSDPFSGAKLSGVSVVGFLVGVSGQIFMTTTDATGAFSHDQGTAGAPRNAYLHVSLNGYVDTYFYPAVPVVSDFSANVSMFTPADLATLGGVVQVGLDPTKTTVIAGVIDCNNAPVGGATVTTTPPGTVRYFVNATPSPSAVATDAADGYALVINVPPGNVTLAATASGMTMRAHNFDAVAGTILQTGIQP